MAYDGSIRVRIGASIDSSVNSAFGGLEQRAQRTAQRVAGMFRSAMAGGFGGGTGTGFNPTGAWSQGPQRQAALMRGMHQQIERDYRAMLGRMDAAHSASVRRRFNEDNRLWNSFVGRLASRTQYMLPSVPVGRIAAGTLAGVARGVGIDWSVMGLTNRATEFESLITKAVVAGWIPDSKDPKQRELLNVNKVMKDVRKVSSQPGAAVNPVVAAQALDIFREVTGDIQGSLQMLGPMLRLAMSVGAEPVSSMQGVGEFASRLKNMGSKDPLQDAYRIALAMVKGGQLGAMEWPHLSKQAGKLMTAVAPYGGDPVANTVIMGAWAQMVRQTTGWTPSVSMNAVARLSEVFKKPARLKQMYALGIKEREIWDENYQLRDPRTLIERLLLASGGDPRKMHLMIGDIMPKRVMDPFLTTFNREGKGEKGLAAVRRMYEPFIGTTSEAEIARRLQLQAGTTAQLSLQFQNELDKIAADALPSVISSLREVQPYMEGFAELIAKIVKLAAAHPIAAGGVGAGIGLGSFLAGPALGAWFQQAMTRRLVERALTTATVGQALAITGRNAITGAATRGLFATGGLGTLGAVASSYANPLLTGAAVMYGLHELNQALPKEKRVGAEPLMPSYGGRKLTAAQLMTLDVPGTPGPVGGMDVMAGRSVAGLFGNSLDEYRRAELEEKSQRMMTENKVGAAGDWLKGVIDRAKAGMTGGANTQVTGDALVAQRAARANAEALARQTLQVRVVGGTVQVEEKGANPGEAKAPRKGTDTER